MAPFSPQPRASIASPERPSVSPGHGMTPVPDAVPYPPLQTFRTVAIALSNGHRPSNTKKAYDPKKKEWYDFCDHQYRSLEPYMRYTVNNDKLYRFIYYQCFREQKTRKGVGRGVVQGFKPSEYDRVMST